VMGLGSRAEVMEPESLRERVREEVRGMAKRAHVDTREEQE
jgi:predicted DNA-binding transcriptional regulator YafY